MAPEMSDPSNGARTVAALTPAAMSMGVGDSPGR